MTWTEIFSRTGTYLTVLSAAVIAVAGGQRDRLRPDFRTFAMLILPVVLLIGVGTFFRLIEADVEDAWMVLGMNRLRHAYIELAPEVETYFIASHHDDRPGMMQTYAFRSRVGVTHWLSGSPLVVGVVDAVVTGVLAAVICQAAGPVSTLRTLVGVLTAVATAAVLGRIR